MSVRRPGTATLRQVASLAGVSIATASRAINGSVASPEATARVRAAVTELGYLADSAARSLRNNRTMTIGAVFFSLRLPGALDLLAALSRQLDEHGYTLLIADTDGRPARSEVILRRLLERRVDALLCVNPHGAGPVLRLYEERGIPALALISRGRGAGRLPLIAPSLEPAASQATQRLEALGHRRVSAVLPGGDAGPFRQVIRRLRDSRMTVDFADPFDPAFSVRDLVLRSARGGVTAMISTYPVALQVLRACLDAGISVPAELSLIVVGEETEHQALAATPLSAIHVDMGALGTAAAGAAIRWLGGSAPPRDTLVPASSWVERASTGPATVASASQGS